jgi:hypothetical protein
MIAETTRAFLNMTLFPLSRGVKSVRLVRGCTESTGRCLNPLGWGIRNPQECAPQIGVCEHSKNLPRRKRLLTIPLAVAIAAFPSSLPIVVPLDPANSLPVQGRLRAGPMGVRATNICAAIHAAKPGVFLRPWYLPRQCCSALASIRKLLSGAEGDHAAAKSDSKRATKIRTEIDQDP